MADDHPYNTILQKLHEGYLLVDEEANICDVNAAYCKMVGYSREELLSMKITDVSYKRALSHQKLFIQDVIENGSQEFETQHRAKDGSRVDLNASAAVVEKDGKIFLAGLLRDITQKKKEQQLIEENRQRFKSLFENNPHSVYYMDLEGNYLGVNSKMEELTGYARQELLDSNFAPLIAEEYLAKTQTNFEKAARGNVQEYEIVGVTKQGKEKLVRVTNFPILIGGNIVGVFGIAEDITKRKRNEEKLKESEERWHRLVENNPQCVVICVDNTIKYINKAGAEILGANKPSKIIGRSQFDFAHPDDWEMIKDRDAQLLNKQKISPSEQRIVDVNDTVKNVMVHSIYIRYKGSDAIQSVLQNITDLKQKEHIIENTLKEKEIMLQEIHHRVKNNMAVISGLLELQAMSIEDADLKKVLKESQLRIHSMAMIHEKLYASESLSEIKFNEYVKELSQTVISSSKKETTKISIHYRLDEVRLNINTAIPCGLILNELIVNAFKHAFSNQEAGTILIGLRMRENEIKFWVEDSGKGMPRDFDIKNQDTLGMTLIDTLTEQINGTLDISAGENNRGTCINVRFEIPE